MNFILAIWILPFALLGNGVQDDQQSKQLKRFKSQLRQRIKIDQSTRTVLLKYRMRTKREDPEKLSKLTKKASDADGENLEWLKEQVGNYGWPRLSWIGKKSQEEFFILVLHADRAPSFQKKCMELMSELPRGEWSPLHYKRLEHRLKTVQKNLPEIWFIFPHK